MSVGKPLGDEVIESGLRKIMEVTPEGICCVCGHKLDDHIDEGKIWRCHHLAMDFYQCECTLRKGRAVFLFSPMDVLFRANLPIITYYDLKRRLNQQLEILCSECEKRKMEVPK